MQNNSQLLGTYIAWEPNAIDNNDAGFQGNTKHSDANGQFAPYWTRSASGQLDVQPSEMDAVNAAQTPNKRGVRPAEWYYCPKDSGNSVRR